MDLDFEVDDFDVVLVLLALDGLTGLVVFGLAGSFNLVKTCMPSLGVLDSVRLVFLGVNESTTLGRVASRPSSSWRVIDGKGVGISS